jgi:hypothetical protein
MSIINSFDITWMGNQVRAEGLDPEGYPHFCMFRSPLIGAGLFSGPTPASSMTIPGTQINL